MNTNYLRLVENKRVQKGKKCLHQQMLTKKRVQHMNNTSTVREQNEYNLKILGTDGLIFSLSFSKIMSTIIKQKLTY